MTTRKLIVFCSLLLIVLIAYIPSSCAEFSHGARATGMGGAYTGLADDGSLVYWNPGALFLVPGWIVELQYGSDGVFAEDVRDTMEFLRDDSLDPMAVADSYTKISDKDWLVKGRNSLSLVVANKKSAFFFNQYDYFFTQPGNEDNPDASYEMSGVKIKEYGVTFSFAGGSNGMSIGLTGKYIDADVYHATPGVSQIPSTEPDDLFDYLESNGSQNSDDNWGLDAGLMVLFGQSRMGFTARNILDYDIEIDENTTIEVNTEYRMGYAYNPTDRFVFAVDYSIGKEEDLLGNDIDGSELAAGIEGIFGESRWLILRAGASMPFGGDSPMIFTFGGGLNFKQAILDIGYAMDSENDTEKLWGGARLIF